MIDSRKPGEQIMKDEQARRAARASTGDIFLRAANPDPSGTTPEPQTHITEGHVLWTLTHDQSTAQARRWQTASGCELELQIWTGAHVAGQEDLCWTQLFASDAALAEAALAKKQQLEASGWLEQIDTTPR
jgi:hypothetical protein